MTRKYRHIEDDFCKEAVIFARVSSEKQEKGASIDAQKESVYEYCKNKGLKIIKEFIITESTIRGERKQYKEMLKFVASRIKKTAIVVNCVDRLQRSYKDTPILDDLRKKGLIEVHFLKENLILSKDSRGIDILFWNMCVLMANSYILSLSDNVRRSLEYNWSQGKWQSLAPIGYLNQKDKHGKSIIVIDEERAPIIKRLFEEYATGLHTAQSLLILACKLGLTAKETYSEETPQRKRFISRTKIYEILRNPFYAGIMCVKGKLMPHIHGKIIDKKLYDQVQQIMDAKGMESEIHKHQQKYKVKKFAFRGLVLCGKCHHLMSPDCKTKTNGKQYTYLRCYNKCGQMPINETILLKQLGTEVFAKFFISPQDFNKIKQSLINHYKRPSHSKIEILNKLVNLICNMPTIMQQADAGTQNEILVILLQNCTLNEQTLSYSLRSPFDKLIEADYHDWKNIITHNFKELSSIEYNLKAINLKED